MKFLKPFILWVVIAITIPPELVSRSTTAVCALYGYSETTSSEPPIQFVKRKLAEMIQTAIISYEGGMARQQQLKLIQSDISQIK